MASGLRKYGPIETAYPDKIEAAVNAASRWQHYLMVHNRAYLVDVANYAMIAFMRPAEPLVTGGPPRRPGDEGVPQLIGEYCRTNCAICLYMTAFMAYREFTHPRFEDAIEDFTPIHNGRIWKAGGVYRLVNNDGARIPL